MRHEKSSAKRSNGESPRPLSIDDNLGSPKQVQTAIGPNTPIPAAAKPIIRRICASAMIVITLAITVTWIFLLGYALVTLIEIAI